MEFMLLIVDRKGAPAGEPVGVAEMGQYAAELAREGKMRGGARLDPEAAGVRVRVQDGKATATDGPFAESKEFIGGCFIIEAPDRAAAIEIAKRCPYTRAGVVEVRGLPDRDVVAPGQGKKFMLLLLMEPDLTDPDLSKYREMVAFDEVLKREGVYLESSQLALDDPRPARVEAQGGRSVVTDGPFAETKEIAGGYYVVAAATRTQAIELAKRCPAAKWGPVEVREVL